VGRGLRKGNLPVGNTPGESPVRTLHHMAS